MDCISFFFGSLVGVFGACIVPLYSMAIKRKKTCVLFRREIGGDGVELKKADVHFADNGMYAYWWSFSNDDMVLLCPGGITEGESGKFYSITNWKPLDGWSKSEIASFEKDCHKYQSKSTNVRHATVTHET